LGLKKCIILFGVLVSVILSINPVSGKNYNGITVNAGEEAHFYNEDIMMIDDGIDSNGIISFDNCSIDLNGKDILISNGKGYFNYSIIENGKKFKTPGLVKNCIVRNLDDFHCIEVKNSTFINLVVARYITTFDNCLFIGPKVIGTWLRYNSITIRTYLNNEAEKLTYNVYRDGTFYKNCTNATYSFLNQSGAHYEVINYTYSANITIDNITYSTTFTTSPNCIIELRAYRDRDLDGIIDLNDNDIDGDGWNNTDELLYSTDQNNSASFPQDLDGDRIPDDYDNDTDGDGWNNTIENLSGTDPRLPDDFPSDIDLDGIPDVLDDDIDGDGWNNTIEGAVGTDPELSKDYPDDQDLDGIPDVLDDDIDGDGFNNSIEENAFTDPYDNLSFPQDLDNDGILDYIDEDLDGDGWNNSIEIVYDTDQWGNLSYPSDQDLDGIPDLVDDDIDGDGFNNSIESDAGTDPYDNQSFPKDLEVPDLDHDGIPDFEDHDMDGDGWDNDMEKNATTDPYDNESFPADLDGDRIPDVLDQDIDGDGVSNSDDAYPYDPDAWEQDIPEDDETPQTAQEAMRENESRALTLMLGTIGIVFIIAMILIIAIKKGSRKKEGLGRPVEDIPMAEVETVMTGFRGYAPPQMAQQIQRTTPVQKTVPLKYTLKGRPQVEHKAPSLPMKSVDMVIVHIPDEK